MGNFSLLSGGNLAQPRLLTTRTQSISRYRGNLETYIYRPVGTWNGWRKELGEWVHLTLGLHNAPP